MKRVYVADIRPGDQVADLFRIIEAQLLPYRDADKGHYLHALLGDRSGQIEARLWEDAEQPASWMAAGIIVEVEARATLYQDHLRLNLTTVAPVDGALVDVAELIPMAGRDVEESVRAVHAAVAQVTAPALQALLSAIFNDPGQMERFCLAPMDQPGCLLDQTWRLLELVAALRQLDYDLDYDLLVAGVLVQRIGLTRGLEDHAGRDMISWLGAAALSDQMLTEQMALIPDFPTDLAIRLRHLVLADEEVGRARSREAVALAHLRQLLVSLGQDGFDS